VLNALIHAPQSAQRRFSQTVEVATGGAAPPSTVIRKMEEMGFHVIHLYGLTESFGPATLCAWQAAWDALAPTEQTAHVARQGVRYPTLDDLCILDPQTLAAVPADGATIGELMLRGNTIMKGYLKNPRATDQALANGWFHTGDLAVMHADGYIEIKDRAKDIIISGGENISSLEIEEVLYRHPAVLEAAVVARADEKWGEIPCAFVTLKADAKDVSERQLIEFCRDHMAHFKAPKKVVFGELPKTATGKIQKTVLRERARTLSD
jgi:fatty-acyl-CoA synthase